MTDDLLERLNMADVTMHPMTLVLLIHEAAKRLDNLENVLIELIDFARIYDVPERPINEAKDALKGMSQ